MKPSDETKLCAGCGADVTNARRMKDAKGRYICAPCVAKLKAKKRGGAGAASSAVAAGASGGGAGGASDQGADIRDFMKQAKEAAKNRCPSCGAFAQPDAVICVNCGYDSRTQGQLQTKFGTAKAAKMKGGGGGGGGGGDGILDNTMFAVGFVLAWIGLTFVVPAWLAYEQQDIMILLITGLLNGISGFVMWIMWLVNYSQRNSLGMAIFVGIVTFILPVGSIIGSFFYSKEGPNKFIRAFATGVLICGAILLISNLSGLTDVLIPTEDLDF